MNKARLVILGVAMARSIGRIRSFSSSLVSTCHHRGAALRTPHGMTRTGLGRNPKRDDQFFGSVLKQSTSSQHSSSVDASDAVLGVVPMSISSSPEEDYATAAIAIEKKSTAPRSFVDKPFEYHQELVIRIDSLTNMGWGVGRIQLEASGEADSCGGGDGSTERDQDDGDETKTERLWVVMVPHVLVGELVKVRIFRNMKSYSEADLIQVLDASPHRVDPRCSLAGTCGGCQYQHMSTEAQREWKTKHVKEVLLQQKIQSYDTDESFQVLPTAGTQHVYEYRSKITPHYQAPNVLDEGTYHLEAVGFQQSSNRKLVDVPECPIATPAINEVYKKKRSLLYEQAAQGMLNRPNGKRKRSNRGSQNGALGATLLFRQADDDEETGRPVVVTDHNEYMTTTVGGLKFRYQAGNFFQNNNHVLPLMVEAVVEAASAPVAGTIGNDGTATKSPSYLIDCYCGSGLFALSAASHFDLCVGIEINGKAIEEASANADLNGISNCQFVAASAEAMFTSPPELTIRGFEACRVQDFPREETVVVLDPPRKGCSEEFLEQLYRYSPQRIVYMSCGPATQARDAKGIVEVGGYEMVSIQPFDLFPQTKHIESLIVFEKRRER
jgi:tRNA (uracil-5-)-methyltransferase